MSVNSRGRTTATVGIPGSGLSYTTSSGPKRSSRSASAPRQAAPVVAKPPAPPKPGAFAPKWERALHKAFAARDFSSLPELAAKYPDGRVSMMILDAFMNVGVHPVRPICEELWAAGVDPAADPFLSKYAPSASATISIATGVQSRLPLNRDALGLMLVELRQNADELAGAVELAESLDPSAPAAVSLCELYGLQQRWGDIVDLTNGLSAVDDFTTYLLTQRGVALREQGYPEAAREAFKASLANRAQPGELKCATWIERAMTYRAEGKKAMARKDLERVLAEDANYPGLREALADLEG